MGKLKNVVIITEEFEILLDNLISNEEDLTNLLKHLKTYRQYFREQYENTKEETWKQLLYITIDRIREIEYILLPF